jgi:shikimate kinase/3-dehydroquinate synthase
MNYDEPSIFLVGMMGSGKTTIGKNLARTLHRTFVDLDHEIEARCGVRIPVVFEIEGETGFRKRESQVLDEMSLVPQLILATGGGAIIAPENRDVLKQRGLVVYLRASVEDLYRRTARDRNRPLLATGDARATLKRLLIEREPLYESVADIILDTGSSTISAVVQELIERVREFKLSQAAQRLHRPARGDLNVSSSPLFPTGTRPMHIVEVATPGGHYPIHIAPGRLDYVGESIPADATMVALITNPVVDQLYGDRVRQSIESKGFKTLTMTLPDGEVHKDWATLNTIFDQMLAAQLDRRAVIVALGGGVIGDMAGFAAAVYMRGIRFVQVPTTLLAQVDSSVGGKTAVNHPLGKNMIGAFYQPIAVEIDTDVLATLPDREISAGLAEVIKYGLIMNAEFFAWCEQHAAALKARDPLLLGEAIRRSCAFKAQVVSADEREAGQRAILNLGHTFGHAIEAGLGYGQWLHGEAVGCGLVMAAALSSKVAGFDAADVARVEKIVANIGCPTRAPSLSGIEEWLTHMQGDKKSQAGTIHFVVMPHIGQARVTPADLEHVKVVLNTYCTTTD